PTSWGVGDYGDLAELARVVGSAGASFVGVSPLHASFPHRPGDASPYSPSSRLFLNWIYIDVESVPDYTASAAARELVASPEVQAELAAVRAASLIDYVAVGKLKRRVLELAFACFKEKHLETGDGRAQSFRAFVDAGGEHLRQHVLYEALQEHLGERDAAAWGWPAWPASYRDPRAPAVAAFAAEHRERLDFFAYLQWIADAQLARAATTAKGAGMRIGLYIDLAVGVDRAGSETWASADVYATSASVGAPPDELALKGQNWGLPPLIPDRLRGTAYAPLVATLRQCMKCAGALRMDHVMALLRLFWVPPGKDATDGAYVYYAFRDLLGILALESVRNRCLVIGEDLGTVPDEVRSALAEHQVLSYRVFYFEQEHDYRPKPPEHYPRCALVTASTHDLPTLRGFWERRDLTLRAELDLYPSAEMRGRQEQGRTVQKQRILGALAERHLAHYQDAILNAPLAQETVRAIYTYLARTPSWLLAVQLEDALDVLDQANLPGTVHEHPNWRRRLPMGVAELGASPGFALLAEALRREGR
ncbi:MAG TPA: 4-alpha-glucanotransferase, partial [Myxococcota bacterium]|nr:4-alpha-glucanotransferase [Myxococcota bacterium]